MHRDDGPAGIELGELTWVYRGVHLTLTVAMVEAEISRGGVLLEVD